MSRTYRKHAESFEAYYATWIDEIAAGTAHDWQIEYIEKEKYRYNTRSGRYYDFTLPKWFRNQVNRKRRARDRQELWKAVNIHDYEEQCSKWNCKDSDAWGYW
jgi:hypothetical protein